MWSLGRDVFVIRPRIQLIFLLDQERAFEEEKNQKIVNWLSPLNFWSKQNDTILQRQEGTGEWMLNHHYFRGWVNGDINVLWCPGARNVQYF